MERLEEPSERRWFNNGLKALLLLFIIVGVRFAYQLYEENHILKNGNVTIGAVVELLPRKGGYSIRVEYKVDDKTYNCILSYDLRDGGGVQIGTRYWLYFLLTEPAGAVYRTERVPSCFDSIGIPSKGWNKKPLCP